MLLMSSPSSGFEQVDFFLEGEDFIFPPPLVEELGDPGEAKGTNREYDPESDTVAPGVAHF